MISITTKQYNLIQRTLNAIETGWPSGKYYTLVIYEDGPHNIKQITYGKSQTTEYGNLRELVIRYCEANGKFKVELEPYIDKIGDEPLSNDERFKTLLRVAGRVDPIMKTVQDQFFHDVYYIPALKWANNNKFTLPLSMLVIFDSFIHSGSILWTIRSKFAESPPAAGGNEKTWIIQYLKARKVFLENHYRPIVRKSVYRVNGLLEQVNKSNWDLSVEPIVVNGIKVYSS